VLVEHYLARLAPRDRELMRLRFQQDLMQREIGALLGVSQMHVSRLISRSLERLRAAATEQAGGAAAGRPSAGEH
jgi:RNA polymerase sigma-B factor